MRPTSYLCSIHAMLDLRERMRGEVLHTLTAVGARNKCHGTINGTGIGTLISVALLSVVTFLALKRQQQSFCCLCIYPQRLSVRLNPRPQLVVC